MPISNIQIQKPIKIIEKNYDLENIEELKRQYQKHLTIYEHRKINKKKLFEINCEEF